MGSMDFKWDSPMGGTQLLIGGCVPQGFPKVGSREHIYLEKCGVLGMQILKICLLRSEILAKQGSKMQFFSYIENRGHMSGALMVNW